MSPGHSTSFDQMVVSAWNGGGCHASGAGYGVRMSSADRDRLVRREWGTVTVELPDGTSATANVDGKAFWKNCPELRSKDIGRWMSETTGYAAVAWSFSPSERTTFRIVANSGLPSGDSAL